MNAETTATHKLVRARKRLALVARSLARKNKALIDQLKERQDEIERHDFLWRSLLEVFSTMGNSRGFDELIRDPRNYSKVTFKALAKVRTSARGRVLEQTLREAKVRWPVKKAEWLLKNFEIIKKMGGPAAAKNMLLKTPGREKKIEFLRSLEGIGPKSARNIMMVVYHPDFRESIAIDERVKAISKELGLPFTRYEDHEHFYLNAARDAGLNGWELDRVIYNFKKDLHSSLQQSK